MYINWSKIHSYQRDITNTRKYQLKKPPDGDHKARKKQTRIGLSEILKHDVPLYGRRQARRNGNPQTQKTERQRLLNQCLEKAANEECFVLAAIGFFVSFYKVNENLSKITSYSTFRSPPAVFKILAG